MDDIQRVNKSFYNRNAREWSSTKTASFYLEQQYRHFFRLLKGGSSILDIGCGCGRDIPLFLGIGRVFSYEGLDISAGMLRIASARYPQLKFYRGNLLERKQLPQKRFAGFWSAAVFQHIPEKDWPAMLRNVNSIMKPNAVGFFTLPANRSKHASGEDTRHFTIMPDGRLRALLVGANWVVIKKGHLPATRRTESLEMVYSSSGELINSSNFGR
jgi:SAM-dependent methyltransferase